MIIAYCENCEGRWVVPNSDGMDPDLLYGLCLDCQDHSDAEKPLEFSIAPMLPNGWLADEE